MCDLVCERECQRIRELCVRVYRCYLLQNVGTQSNFQLLRKAGVLAESH